MLEELLGDAANSQWFQVAMLLTIAMAASFLFVRLGLPKIVGQIAVGIVIGPSALGIVELELDPEEVTSIVSLLAGFGAIVMLFMIGLECEIREIYTGKNIVIAIGGIVLPWVGGYLLAEFMLPDPGQGFDRFSQSIFVGTALVATSVAITAGVLKELGIVGSKVAKTILGAAIVDDVLGMVALAITAGVAKGDGLGLGDVIWITLAAVLFVALGSYLGSKFVVKVISAVERKGLKYGLVESGFLLALGFAFLYAFVSNEIGISAIVGAFIAGTSFSRCEYRRQFMEGIVFLEWAFAPIFFISLGVLVDVRLPLEIWMFAAALAAVALLSKVVGGGLPARLLGMSRSESLSVGLGMSPRLEVAMIIALFGLTEGIINSQVYSVIIITGLITVLIAPVLLRRTARGIRQQDLAHGDQCDARP